MTLDGVAGDDGIINQQAERNNESCDGDLLQIDAKQVGESEGQREGDRNRNRHQHRGAPFPESHEGNDDDEGDRFVQRVHEEVDVFFNLARLVGGWAMIRSAGRWARFGQLFFTCSPNFAICSAIRI